MVQCNMTINDLKVDTHELYKSVGSLWCPAVKTNVVFNRHGWIHMSFSSNGRRRSAGDLKLRHHLFEHVHEVVKRTKIVIKKTSGDVTSRNGITRTAKYYEIAYLCSSNKHVTVILRKIEEGKLHYYSVRRTSNKNKKTLAKAGLL